MAGWRVGQEHVIEITGLSHDASGVGRAANRAVFVPGALPGDRVKVRLVHLKERYGYGELLEIMEASADRREPSCPHAPECGGCQLQHMDYEAQLRWKRQLVADAFQRIGGLELEVRPTLGMSRPYHYRNKSQLPLGQSGGSLVMGFFRTGSHDIVDLETCEIQHPLITKLALAVKRIVKDLSVEPYDEINHTGVLRHAVIRVSFSRKELMLILVTRTPELPCRNELIARLRKEVPELVSIAHNINPDITNVILGRETQIIWGADYLMASIGHLDYAISPGSFFQVNPGQTKVLYDLVREALQLTGKETLLDLYCGAGTIGLYLASDAKEVIGVETFAAAVEDARYNAQLNGIDRSTFYVGRAEKVLPELVNKHGSIDGAVLDPPRKGCDQSLLETLAAAQIPKICYVSCNPSTLARDLSILADLGYSAGSVQPVDMFPWTRHVETIVLLQRETL